MSGQGSIHRYEVPVDGDVHTVRLTGPVLFVSARRSRVVEFWAFTAAHRERVHRLRAVGTGELLPEGTLGYHGTALDGPYVWHLIEVR